MAHPSGSRWLLRNAEVAGIVTDVRLRGGRIAALGRHLPDEPDERRLDARGGALLPGLHDHHLHLLALAAALDSVRCGPPEVSDAEGLAAALHRAARGADPVRGLRGVGYHESVAGDLDRHALDRLGSALALPIRIQHRSGARWILNTRALAQLRVHDGATLPRGLERGADGEPTGRLDRADEWLRDRLGDPAWPDLARVGARLAAFGVSGLCDATPGNDARVLAVFEQASRAGALPQRVQLMGTAALPRPTAPRIVRGARKLVLDENALPERDAFVAEIRASHASARAVAVHCVTRAELLFAVSAFAETGVHRGDRIEHASVAPPELLELLAALPLTVVTQPNFVCERGDAYLAEVEPGEQRWLYRGRGFLDAAVALAGGTDAPFGDPDPWRAMRAACERRTARGAELARDEALDAEEALGLFTGPLDEPGRAAERLCVGGDADLCLLALPWARVRERLDAGDVAAVWIAGERVAGEGDVSY